MCDSKDLLVGYLYDELDATARRTFEAHLSSCAECREETAGLRATRAQLARWAPPEPDFAFTIVRRPTTAPAPRFRMSPAWGLAAAALLVLAAGAAIANLEVRYGQDGLVIQTGWNKSAGPAPVPPSSSEARVTPAEWQALNRRLGELEASAASRSQPVTTVSQPKSDAEIRRLVLALLGASETRQQRALAKLTQDVGTQRQVLVAISQSMTRLQNASDDELRQYRELILRGYRNTAYQQSASQK